MENKFLENNRKNAILISDILQLKGKPVAIKFIKQNEIIPDLIEIFNKKLRYCQLLMEAKQGNCGYINPENLTCPAAASAFGFKPLPEKIENGTMLKSLGLFEKEEYGKMLMEKIPRLPLNSIKKIIAIPLENSPFEPDIIIIEDMPEKIMWIALASLRLADGRHSFSTGIFQACCVDITVIPYLSQNVNASLGCYGCRDATDLKDDECLIGIPFKFLGEIISSLEFLSKKAMITVRSKKVYNLYLDNSDRG